MSTTTKFEWTCGGSGGRPCGSRRRSGRGGAVGQERRLGTQVGAGAGCDRRCRVAQDGCCGSHVAVCLVAGLVKRTVVGGQGAEVKVELLGDLPEFVLLIPSATSNQNHQPVLRLGQVVEPISVMLGVEHASSKRWV